MPSAPSVPPGYYASAYGEDPFWNYEEVALFIGAIFPTLLLSALVRSLIEAVIPAIADSEATHALVLQLLMYAMLLGTIHLMFWLRHERPMWASLGWTLHFDGAWQYLALAPLLAISLSVLAQLLHAPEFLNPVESLVSGRASMAAVALFAVILGPIFEELVFRGFLFPLFRKSFGAWPGIFLSSVLFSSIHGDQYEWSWQHLLVVMLAGMAFGYARHRSGSTAASTLLHAGYNLTGLIPMLLQQ